jgi:predicted phosphohydrolase
MAIYAIADLHLSLGTNKPMNIFGPAWDQHDIRIEENWRELVGDNDTVLIPGDISWAMTPEEALADLMYIDRLPGEKIITKGNHDYWWGTSGKIEKMMSDEGLSSIRLLKNNAFYLDGTIVCGTRGWLLPEHTEFTASDRLVFDREVGRLARSLRAGEKLRQSLDDRIVVMMHYPPIFSAQARSEFGNLCIEFGVDICVYGHLHGRGHEKAVIGVVDGVDHRLVSADYIAFKPLRL